MKPNKNFKIVVVSDTHRNLELVNKVALIERDADYYLHLGDSEVDSEKIRPFISVKGNCDHFRDYPRTRMIKITFGTIYLIHHLEEIPLRKDFVIDKNIKIVLFGHTHRRFLKLIGGVYYVNPGSLTLGRDGHEHSYLVIAYHDGKFDFDFQDLSNI